MTDSSKLPEKKGQQRSSDLTRVSTSLVRRGLDLIKHSLSQEITVLVIDDEDRMRDLLSRGINFETGFRVVGTAKDGAEGVELALELRPRLIIMNGAMPALDGFSATRQIKRHLPEVKIVMDSVYFSERGYPRHQVEENIRRAKGAGADAWIGRPWEFVALLQLLRKTVLEE
ncbi:MAG: response regulator transcription factor [Anaerolineales bacterium]